MIQDNPSCEEIKEYIERQDGFNNVNVNVLGKSFNRNITWALISWEQEANIQNLRGICSNIINKRGVDITYRFTDPLTTAKRGVLSKILYRYRSHHIRPPKMVNMFKYERVRHNKKVKVTMHNVFIISNGVGVVRFTS
jgi:hypothetical protein